MTGVRVVVAAGSALRRAAMVRLLQDAGLEVPSQAGDAGDLLRTVRAHRPDMAIAEPPGELRQPSTTIAGVHALPASVSGAILRTPLTADHPLPPRPASLADARPAQLLRTDRWEVKLRQTPAQASRTRSAPARRRTAHTAS